MRTSEYEGLTTLDLKGILLRTCTEPDLQALGRSRADRVRVGRSGTRCGPARSRTKVAGARRTESESDGAKPPKAADLHGAGPTTLGRSRADRVKQQQQRQRRPAVGRTLIRSAQALLAGREKVRGTGTTTAVEGPWADPLVVSYLNIGFRRLKRSLPGIVHFLLHH